MVLKWHLFLKELELLRYSLSLSGYSLSILKDLQKLVYILPGLVAFIYLGALFRREIRTNKYISLQFPK